VKGTGDSGDPSFSSSKQGGSNMPANKPIDPPSNLPMLDEDEPKEVLVPEEKKPKSEMKTEILGKPKPKTVPGVRGPIPTRPDTAMKVSSAKFGAVSPLHKLSNGNTEQPKVDSSNASPEPKKPETASSKTPYDIMANIPASPVADEGSMEKQIAQAKDKKIPAGKPLGDATPRPKISVPLPPTPPASATPPAKDDDAAKTSSAPKGIPAEPASPKPLSVDRNIRPRRFAILVIFLLVFVGAVIFIIWLMLSRGNRTAPVESPLFSGDASPSVVPSADVFINKDTDNDGLTDEQEQQLGTDINKADTDGDGYNDKQELDGGYDPLMPGGKLDSDRDGLSDPGEKCWQSDAKNPDTDGDGYLDGQEVTNNYDPLIPSPNDKLQASKCQGL